MEIRIVDSDEEFLELMRESIMQDMAGRWFTLYRHGMEKFNDHKKAFDYASEQYEKNIRRDLDDRSF